ncbi:hypothetical protein [Rubrobacter aplysinae]|uniref:hypothetical protein n=1 Tax=Rubrobacter aplysinae TaxID=909625 RepID=UPI00064BADAF|nr:hypothetical protein [Rubrobacter aplysinae]
MSYPDDHLSQRHQKTARGSARLYRKLLVAYPEDFREEYAEEMVRYFGELCEESLKEGGVPALVVTWLRTLWELARSSHAERRRSTPDVEVDAPSATALSLLVFFGAGQIYNRQFIKGTVLAVLPIVVLPTIGLWPWLETEILTVIAATWIYSAVDALLSARRIKTLQRAATSNSDS